MNIAAHAWPWTGRLGLGLVAGLAGHGLVRAAGRLAGELAHRLLGSSRRWHGGSLISFRRLSEHTTSRHTIPCPPTPSMLSHSSPPAGRPAGQPAAEPADRGACTPGAPGPAASLGIPTPAASRRTRMATRSSRCRARQPMRFFCTCLACNTMSHLTAAGSRAHPACTSQGDCHGGLFVGEKTTIVCLKIAQWFSHR